MQPAERHSSFAGSRTEDQRAVLPFFAGQASGWEKAPVYELR